MNCSNQLLKLEHCPIHVYGTGTKWAMAWKCKFGDLSTSEMKYIVLKMFLKIITANCITQVGTNSGSVWARHNLGYGWRIYIVFWVVISFVPKLNLWPLSRSVTMVGEMKKRALSISEVLNMNICSKYYFGFMMSVIYLYIWS